MASAKCIRRLKDVCLVVVERRGEWLCAEGFVKSESEPRKWYYTRLCKRPGAKNWIGFCECPDFRYRGGPCKHMARLKQAIVARRPTAF